MQIFSPIPLVASLLVVFFPGQKIFSLMLSHLFILALTACVFGDFSMKYFSIPISWRVLPLFYTNTIMVS